MRIYRFLNDKEVLTVQEVRLELLYNKIIEKFLIKWVFIIKIDRLIGIITVLLQKDKVTAPLLAEKFEVSRRTINRDIEDICKAGIPIVTTQGYERQAYNILKMYK